MLQLHEHRTVHHHDRTVVLCLSGLHLLQCEMGVTTSLAYSVVHLQRLKTKMI